MRGVVVRVSVLAALATVGFAIAFAAAPGRRALTVAAYVLALSALAVAGLVATVSAVLPPARVRRKRPAAAAEKPLAQLESIESALQFGKASSFDLHYRLRPLIQEVVAARLARRRGINLVHQPDRARSVLSERVWELVRPDREPPVDRFDKGWSDAELRAVVHELEAI